MISLYHYVKGLKQHLAQYQRGVQQADVFAWPFGAQFFDHVFVCFVLEHLSRPVIAWSILRDLLRPGGPSPLSRAVMGRHQPT
jgi:hypothetical protein